VGDYLTSNLPHLSACGKEPALAVSARIGQDTALTGVLHGAEAACLPCFLTMDISRLRLRDESGDLVERPRMGSCLSALLHTSTPNSPRTLLDDALSASREGMATGFIHRVMANRMLRSLPGLNHARAMKM